MRRSIYTFVFLALIGTVGLRGLSTPPNLVSQINEIPACISPQKISTERCPEINEVFCSTECPTAGNECYVLDSVVDTTGEEREQLNAGAATGIDVYPACPLDANNCKLSQVVNIIACSSDSDCSCGVLEGSRKCILGQTVIFSLFKYKPRRSIGCDASPPA